jgi:hypothetical protein
MRIVRALTVPRGVPRGMRATFAPETINDFAPGGTSYVSALFAGSACATAKRGISGRARFRK